MRKPATMNQLLEAIDQLSEALLWVIGTDETVPAEVSLKILFGPQPNDELFLDENGEPDLAAIFAEMDDENRSKAA